MMRQAGFRRTGGETGVRWIGRLADFRRIGGLAGFRRFGSLAGFRRFGSLAGFRRTGREAGFTLLEVIIALIIAGMAAAALMAAVGTSLRATRTAAAMDQALVRAKSRLAAATHGERLVPGDTRGDDGGGFRWHLHVAPVASATIRPVGVVGPRAAASVPVVLYAVTVWIGWDDGGTEREVRLDTEQIGG